MKDQIREIFKTLDQTEERVCDKVDKFFELLQEKHIRLEMVHDLASQEADIAKDDSQENFLKHISELISQFNEDKKNQTIKLLCNLIASSLNILDSVTCNEGYNQDLFLFDLSKIHTLEDLYNLANRWSEIAKRNHYANLQKRITSIVIRLIHLLKFHDEKIIHQLATILLENPRAITNETILSQLESICDFSEEIITIDEKLDSSDIHQILSDLQKIIKSDFKQKQQFQKIKNKMSKHGIKIDQSTTNNESHKKTSLLDTLLNNREDRIYDFNLLLQKLTKTIKTLEEKTKQDDLTHLFNRHHLNDSLERLESHYQSEGKNYSILFFDIDGFKGINDRYGHILGDEILVIFSKILKENSRSSDIVGRYGGDEFLILMPNTNLKDAKEVALRICSMVEKEGKQQTQQKNLSITTSVGVAERKGHKNKQETLHTADMLLYKAKTQGRNQVQWS